MGYELILPYIDYASSRWLTQSRRVYVCVCLLLWVSYVCVHPAIVRSINLTRSAATKEGQGEDQSECEEKPFVIRDEIIETTHRHHSMKKNQSDFINKRVQYNGHYSMIESNGETKWRYGSAIGSTSQWIWSIYNWGWEKSFLCCCACFLFCSIFFYWWALSIY